MKRRLKALLMSLIATVMLSGLCFAAGGNTGGGKGGGSGQMGMR